MLHHATIDAAIAGLGLLATVLITGTTGTVLAQTDGIPQWTSLLFGQAGALVGTIFAVGWLAKRLKAMDEKQEKNEEFLRNVLEKVTIATVTAASAVTEAKLALHENTDYLDAATATLNEVKAILK